jgi:2-dehydropantoate 2-reductase
MQRRATFFLATRNINAAEPVRSTKILVLGAGAVGGYFGGRLAEAGADVTFLVRERRAAQLAEHGLIIKSPLGDLRLPVETVMSGRIDSPYDVVLLTAKAYDLESAMDSITPALGPESAVLPLLNGIGHLDALDRRFGAQRVLGGVAHIASTLSPDGEILHLNRVHAFTYGERNSPTSARCEALAADLAKTSLAWRLTPNIEQALWEKFVMLASLAAMTCLMRASVGKIMRAEDGKAITLELLEECRQVAAAEGCDPRPEQIAQNRTMLTDPTSEFTASMLRDIEAGGRTEGEHIIGDMLRRARARGIAAPLLRVASCHLQSYEARHAAASAP